MQRKRRHLREGGAVPRQPPDRPTGVPQARTYAGCLAELFPLPEEVMPFVSLIVLTAGVPLAGHGMMKPKLRSEGEAGKG